MPSIVLLHASDCHFGSIPTNDQYAKAWPWTLQNPHSYTLARGLHEAVDDVAAFAGLPDDQFPYFPVSGDLTATGHEKEFLVAHTFLRSRFRASREPESDLIGFDVRDPLVAVPGPRLATVPGNHDQWQGKGYMKSVGYTPGVKPKHFRKTPWKREWRSGNLLLELWGIDSNAGLSTTNGTWSQDGEFDLSKQGEFDQLEQDLKSSNPSDPFVVRALMFHHTVSDLEPASAQRVLEAAEKFPIAAFLTGHVHDVAKPTWDTLPNKSRKVQELRSASALQGPETRVKPSPGFLVHKIEVDGQKTRWRAWPFVWDQKHQQFALDPNYANTPFVDFNPP